MMIEAMRYYTASESARLIGVHRSTIIRDCNAGALPYKIQRKAGTKLERKYIAGRDLERYRLRQY